MQAKGVKGNPVIKSSTLTGVTQSVVAQGTGPQSAPPSSEAYKLGIAMGGFSIATSTKTSNAPVSHTSWEFSPMRLSIPSDKAMALLKKHPMTVGDWYPGHIPLRLGVLYEADWGDINTGIS